MNQPGTTDSTRATVLIADDEPHIRHLVGVKLRLAGFHVLVASNGRAGLDLAREHRPALIITDFQMPVLSGFEMSQALAQDHQTAHIPIILLTARGHKLTPQELASTSIRLVMDKPFGPTDLIARVQGMLKKDAA